MGRKRRGKVMTRRRKSRGMRRGAVRSEGMIRRQEEGKKIKERRSRREERKGEVR